MSLVFLRSHPIIATLLAGLVIAMLAGISALILTELSARSSIHRRFYKAIGYLNGIVALGYAVTASGAIWAISVVWTSAAPLASQALFTVPLSLFVIFIIAAAGGELNRAKMMWMWGNESPNP